MVRFGVPLPQRVSSSAQRLVQFEMNRRDLQELFSGRRLTWDSRGYWKVNPMPSDSQLADYYATTYWSARGDQPSRLRGRDLSHFLDLDPLLDSVATTSANERKALNFGAGHGGISFLLRAKGFRVLNVDPSPTPSPFFITSTELPSERDEFGLVYSSHSLEHVTDPESTIKALVDCLRPGGILYVEVPNALAGMSSQDEHDRHGPAMHPPHTVYFTRTFFEGLPLRTVRLGTFDYQDDVSGLWRDDDVGEVIRYIGAK